MIHHKQIYVICILYLLLLPLSCNNYNQSNIHLALVAPLTGETSSYGNAYLNGVRMVIDEINQQGGVNGKQIILDIYDDQNNSQLATKRAKEIVQKQRAVGVIGHHYSSCSIAGGDVYKQYGIPAISPTSTNIHVTLNNPWYFRVTFHDNYQARFLANYAVKILQKKQCIIISETQAYGAYISDIFKQKLKHLDCVVHESYTFNSQNRSLDNELKRIVQSIHKNEYDEDDTFIFIASHVPEGIQLIKMIREYNMNHVMLLPDAFAGKSFVEKIIDMPSEKLNPGYYTNNIFVASPFIYDIANKSAQIFKQKYMEIYHDAPDWRAAFAYDAARIMIHAIQKTQISGNREILKQERQAIRDCLLSMNNSEKGINGLTGMTWFDKNGDAAKPLSIGTFYQHHLVSAFTQLKVVNRSYSKTTIQKKMADNSIVVIDGQCMDRTNIIYTGININAIEEVDFSNQTHLLDFYIWFKYRGIIDVSDIHFLNARGPVAIRKPIQKEDLNGEHYEMYHIKGTFALNTSEMFVEADNNILGFSFRHSTKTAKNLVYVSDISGMNEVTDLIMMRHLNRSLPMISNSGYVVEKLIYFSDIVYKNIYGNPRYLSDIEFGGVAFSCYNFFIRISEKKVSFRRISWNFYLNLILCITSILVTLVMITLFKPLIITYPRMSWLLQFILGFMLLISSEPLFLTFFSENDNLNYFSTIKLVYDILWWIVPATLINLAIKRFVWVPLEQKTNRNIPKIVTNSVIFFVYLLTFFGIIAYVFDQKLTSLLATSGVLAMIIGLAIQVNITNIFSGIVINVEQPFRIGDWIKIDHKFKGKVIDITWRTTRILTQQGNILCFPNSYTSESPINNYCYPDNNVWVKVIIHVNPTYSPEKIKKICMDAMLSIDGLAKDSTPLIRFQLSDWSADYILLFCINDYEKKLKYKSDVYERIWVHLNRIGIEPAIQRQEIHMFKGIKDRGEEALSPLSILNEIDIFKSFTDEIKQSLSQKMHQHFYQPDDVIIQQGDQGDSLFIIVEGSVSVRILINEEFVEVDRMGASSFFGEMALLTGEPRNASIVAISNCLLYEITKCDIAPLFNQHPEITEILSNELTRRTVNREKKEDKYNSERIDKEALNKSFISKISNYFGLGKNGQKIVTECADAELGT